MVGESASHEAWTAMQSKSRKKRGVQFARETAEGVLDERSGQVQKKAAS